MSRRIIVVGAGMGGLTAALRLKLQGFDVLVLEARDAAGGLASGLHIEGLAFDAGPYILLDRPGLEWIFRELRLDILEKLSVIPFDPVYEVNLPGGEILRVYRSLDQTAAAFDACWPGSGAAYTNFVLAMRKRHHALRPWLYSEHPGPIEVVLRGAWKQIPFLSKSLSSVMDAAKLQPQVKEAVAIWTRVAGQNPADAPSPMAFVPALIHTDGAYYPASGIRSIPEALADEAVKAGIEFRFMTQVKRIVCTNRKVEGVLTETGELISCDAVVSGAHGLSTYEQLAQEAPEPVKQRLRSLPLQSPGLCLYLAVRRNKIMPYLRFRIPGAGELCRLLVSPGNLQEPPMGDWQPARIIVPMKYEDALQTGPQQFQDLAERLVNEAWWREGISEYRLLKTRTPAEWGREYYLYRDSMNPVMTAQFMRRGRLAHRSPWIRGLYLAGSSTGPGQWVSFCGISGILAADCLHKDLS